MVLFFYKHGTCEGMKILPTSCLTWSQGDSPPTVPANGARSVAMGLVVRIGLRLDSNRALRDFLTTDHYPCNRMLMNA
jgi:hypothetical protein